MCSVVQGPTQYPRQQCNHCGEGAHSIKEWMGYLESFHPQGAGGGAAGHTPDTEQDSEAEIEGNAAKEYSNVHQRQSVTLDDLVKQDDE